MTPITLVDTQATELLGGCLARAAPVGQVIHLRGELGTGKTTLVRGFMRALGFQGAVKSPTYTLMEPYTVGDQQVLHCDFYRLADPLELEFLGLRDFLDEQTILLVEWPEQGGELTPAADLDILLTHAEESRNCQIAVTTSGGKQFCQRFEVEWSRANRTSQE
ncbi:MAG: tRNA (adenosine(37)-N6)-threonylcarbamoyltransferase complex ATPase subunit type 1 TsaE [Candidatus Competibacteraceae bacterium]|jgi:tRNA threonylcarbamoyladenosine biosynthesis protein TsaE|nr:tRNA (adenosine(37)-N6)-threonylcarbamoyltransferase complex ATPase subunit type 1 TsaE [Candidatus Competibacteraceae bacterium]